MRIFYIDTSSSYLYSAIIFENEIIASIKENFGKDLSKYALLEIKKMFEKANIDPKQIDKIIVVSGPGSFTGIRIGMTIAKIYAYTLKKEITTITSLEAMETSCETNKIIVPIIDARRGFVYAGVYNNNIQILKDQYIKLDDLLNYLSSYKDNYVFVTNDLKFSFPNTLKYDPNFLKIIQKYKSRKSLNPHLVKPTYLKLTEAEENFIG